MRIRAYIIKFYLDGVYQLVQKGANRLSLSLRIFVRSWSEQKSASSMSAPTIDNTLGAIFLGNMIAGM